MTPTGTLFAVLKQVLQPAAREGAIIKLPLKMRRWIAISLVRLATRKDEQDEERKAFYDQIYRG